jgi:hypothetical protein
MGNQLTVVQIAAGEGIQGAIDDQADLHRADAS